MYTAVKIMGPKLIMIRKMLVQLCLFMLIMFLFIFAFGICIQALTYHNMPLDWNLFINVFMPAVFVIGGQYDNYQKYLQAEQCNITDLTRLDTDMYTNNDCPDFVGSQIAMIIYAVYVLFLNILLLNILIAILR